MIIQKLLKLDYTTLRLHSCILFAHTETCPARKLPICPPPGSKSSQSSGGTTLKRGTPGKVRLGIFPDEWFTFFHSKTGVTGPYLLGILLTNYVCSKEIYVMEHEYYIGLSIFVITVAGTKLFGQDVAKYLDSEIANLEKELEDGVKNQKKQYETTIKLSKEMQMQALGQKMLMDAKKENVAMQIEAVYRERIMHVYETVKNRLDYHVKRNRIENRIRQKWMLEWILDNVKKSITPDFEKRALSSAIKELGAMTARA